MITIIIYAQSCRSLLHSGPVCLTLTEIKRQAKDTGAVNIID